MNRALPALAVTIALLIVSGTPAAVVGAAPTAAMPSDFDGDGYADLAIGAPQSQGREGSVSVLYGGTKGLTASGDDLWTQDSSGVHGGAESADRFGTALASGDFDRDGYADLAIGVPGEDPAPPTRYGAIAVLRGSPTGLTATGDQLWTHANLSGGGDARGLGSSLAAADIDGDGYWDLVAGAPSSRNLDGVAIVMFGGPSGLTDGDVQVLDRSLTGAEDDPSEYYAFGLSVGAGDVDGDGRADLVVGIGGNDSPGEVALFPGSPSGIDTGTAELWGPDSAGIATGTAFGRALVIADFDDDGYGDLAAGSPGQSVSGPGSGYGAGAVNVLYGSADGLTAEGNQLWRQSSSGVPGSDEPYDLFGLALAAADFDGDGFADLAVGVPGEDWKRDFGFGRGAVTVFYGSGGGLSADGVQHFTQGTPGIPNRREDGDSFGRSLAAGDYGRRGTFDLAIGVPYEGHSGVNQAGLVTVLYTKGSRLTAGDAQVWTKGTDGVKGAVDHEFFGSDLGS